MYLFLIKDLFVDHRSLISAFPLEALLTSQVLCGRGRLGAHRPLRVHAHGGLQLERGDGRRVLRGGALALAFAFFELPKEGGKGLKRV